MVALAARKYLSIANDSQYLGREEGLWIICDSDDDEFHRLSGI
jgi:hypothetical protein